MCHTEPKRYTLYTEVYEIRLEWARDAKPATNTAMQCEGIVSNEYGVCVCVCPLDRSLTRALTTIRAQKEYSNEAEKLGQPHTAVSR